MYAYLASGPAVFEAQTKAPRSRRIKLPSACMCSSKRRLHEYFFQFVCIASSGMRKPQPDVGFAARSALLLDHQSAVLPSAERSTKLPSPCSDKKAFGLPPVFVM